MKKPWTLEELINLIEANPELLKMVEFWRKKETHIKAITYYPFIICSTDGCTAFMDIRGQEIVDNHVAVREGEYFCGSCGRTWYVTDTDIGEVTLTQVMTK